MPYLSVELLNVVTSDRAVAVFTKAMDVLFLNVSYVLCPL